MHTYTHMCRCCQRGVWATMYFRQLPMIHRYICLLHWHLIFASLPVCHFGIWFWVWFQAGRGPQLKLIKLQPIVFVQIKDESRLISLFFLFHKGVTSLNGQALKLTIFQVFPKYICGLLWLTWMETLSDLISISLAHKHIRSQLRTSNICLNICTCIQQLADVTHLGNLSSISYLLRFGTDEARSQTSNSNSKPTKHLRFWSEGNHKLVASQSTQRPNCQMRGEVQYVVQRVGRRRSAEW